MNSPRQLLFFVTPPQVCPYLPGRESVSLFAEPAVLDNALYGRLARIGFRRSGDQVYRPACGHCQACVPVRIPVEAFRPRRRDRRNLGRNAGLELRINRAHFSAEHFQLYATYLEARHPGGGMDAPTPEQFERFLIGTWSDTWFLELHLEDRLVAVAVTDRLEDGLSAVYTFYDPALTDRGLGHHCILRQIAYGRDLGLPYLYLGYWVEGSDKMGYKGQYRPLQALRGDRWVALA